MKRRTLISTALLSTLAMPAFAATTAMGWGAKSGLVKPVR